MEEKKNNEKKGGRGGKRPNTGPKSIFRNKKISMGLKFTSEIWEKLQILAQKRNCSNSDFLHFLILEEYERTHTHPAQKEP